ncbi:alpha/beta hydrolase [Spirulina sp. CS-785/01]|uniref:alpha/beta fold hydrolase n=1 Tax=Spirulina sp. CS-785/01 TaxID=3021716 RepID=UPI00232FF3E8|nr:alpha/beta hydrolase [Spirulina sp. CS-785/01]MDB9311525.1 alpha/beta hydrolase [Spirulina sp. CS-785/01]
MAKITISGVSHSYDFTSPVADSDAPVLVFLHGWLLSRCYWQPLVEQLRDRYRCLTYDLRGFGESQPEKTASSTSGYTLADYAQDLVTLLQQLEIKKAWLIGHSLGGSIALWGADLLPEHIDGVICLNAGGGIYLKEEFERFRSVGQKIVQNRPGWLSYIPLMDWVFGQAMVARPLARSWGRQRLRDFLRADSEAALGSLLESTTESQVHLLPQIVARLEQPVYFLAGMRDTVMEPKYVHHLASFHKLFQQSRNNVIEIPDCGHLAMLEDTGQVLQQIEGILKNHGVVQPVDASGG